MTNSHNALRFIRYFQGGTSFRDTRPLTIWISTRRQLLSANSAVKRRQRRTIKINAQFKPHIQACYEAIHPRSLDRPCFISQKHGVYSVQRINVLLKDIKKKYNLKAERFSTHSLRKTFGRKIFELASSQGQGEIALIKLSELFNHSNASITRIYLGIKEEGMLSTYDMLEF